PGSRRAGNCLTRHRGHEAVYGLRLGGRWDRPELHRLLDQLRPGDVVIVWELDRLSRSLKDLLHIMERTAQAEAGFRSLTEAIDTTTPAGRMRMRMVGGFAEFERGGWRIAPGSIGRRRRMGTREKGLCISYPRARREHGSTIKPNGASGGHDTAHHVWYAVVPRPWCRMSGATTGRLESSTRAATRHPPIV